MEIDNYIKFCKYYKGEETNPFESGDSAMFWSYESIWVERNKNGNTDFFSDIMDEYQLAGLEKFSANDGTPTTLKALLFNRYAHWLGYSLMESAIDFKKWYKVTYKKTA